MASCKGCVHYDVCKDNFSGLYKICVDEPEKHLELNPNVEEVCEHFKADVQKVRDLIDTIISHNEIVGIWERRKNKEGRYHALLWKGMAWDIPKEYLDRTFLKIFGTVPESITEADTVNIAVTPILISEEEAEQALKERESNA